MKRLLKVAAPGPILVDVVPGTSLSEAKQHAAMLVFFLGHPVRFDLNGKSIIVRPGDVPGLMQPLLKKALS